MRWPAVVIAMAACGGKAAAPAPRPAPGATVGYCASAEVTDFMGEASREHYCKQTLEECRQVAEQYALMSVTMECTPVEAMYCWQYTDPASPYGTELHCEATAEECNENAVWNDQQNAERDETRDMLMGGPPPPRTECMAPDALPPLTAREQAASAPKVAAGSGWSCFSWTDTQSHGSFCDRDVAGCQQVQTYAAGESTAGECAAQATAWCVSWRGDLGEGVADQWYCTVSESDCEANRAVLHNQGEQVAADVSACAELP